MELKLKRLLPGVSCIILFLAIYNSASGQNYNLQFAKVSNNGSTLTIKVQAQFTSAENLGSSNLVFTYDGAELNTPTLGTIHNFSGGDYQTMTLTEPFANGVSLNIEYTGADGGGTAVPTGSFIDVAEISFTIPDESGTANFVWQESTTTRTVVYQDDNDTRLSSGTLTSNDMSLDATAPSFESSTPSVADETQDTFTLSVDIDESGTIYYVIVANDATAPSSVQVKAGTDSDDAAALDNGSQVVNSGDFDHDFSITGLTAGTDYDVYVVAEDAIGNLQDSPTKVDVSTLAAPSVAFSATSSDGNESVTSANLQVALSGTSSQDVMVNYTVTGTATGGGTDYTLADGSITISAGNTTNDITIASIVGDAIVEANETVIVTLSAPTNATLGTNTVHTYTITNDDQATVTITDVTPNENDGTVDVTFTLDNAVDGGFDVDVSTADNTATTADSDYTAITNQTVTFAGTASEQQTVTITLGADTKVEADEIIDLSMSNLVPATADAGDIDITGTGTVTITNDDAATVTITDVTPNENDGTVDVTFTLDNAVDGGFALDVSTADNTATTADSDYTAITNQTVTFAGTASEQQTVTITLGADTKVEADEIIDLSMSNLVPATADAADIDITGTGTVTITNDDAATVTITDVTPNENDGTVDVTFTLDNAVDGGFDVDVSTADNTATTADGDYTAITNQTVTFAGTASEQETVTITLGADTKVEADEIIDLSMSNLVPATADAADIDITGTGTVTITNDDQATVTIADVSGNEDDGPITVTVTLDVAVDEGFDVNVSTADGTATTADSDYTAVTNQTLTFDGTAGETQTFTVTPTTDGTSEGNETLTVTMSGLVPVTVDAVDIDVTGTGTVTITNDDADVTAPDKPVITGISDDTGISSTDGITSDRNLMVHGTSEPNALIKLYKDGFNLGSATADANGDWAVDASHITIPNTTGNVTVTATDQAGNISVPSDPYTITVDFATPTQPVITGISDDTGISSTDGITSDRNLLVSGTSEPNALIKLYAGGTNVNNATADANGDWTVDVSHVTLPNITFNITVTATDQAGNLSEVSAPYTVVVDYEAPAKPIITHISDDTGVSNTDGITSDRNITVSGTSEANALIKLYKDGFNLGNATADANGDWTVDVTHITIQNTTGNVSVTATDKAGNISESSDPFGITIDYVAPAKPVITHISDDTGTSSTDGITSDRNITVSGTSEANALIKLYKDGFNLGSATADANGDWTIDVTHITISNTTGNITVTATDKAGNVSPVSDPYTITVDYAAPTVSLSAPSTPSGNSFTVTAQFSEAVTGFNLDDVSVTGGSSADFVSIDADTYTFTVTSSNNSADVSIAANLVEDIAGNLNQASNSLTLDFTGSAPVVSLQNLTTDIAKPKEVNIYPNPASDFLTIDLRTLDNVPADLAIYSTEGVSQFSISNNTESLLKVNVSSYAQGLYLVLINDGVNTIKKRVMIRR